ncbi:two-component system, cell cycle sensor histidine kinase and response regulator CckA [Albimonas donghaensis]|uniref:histidine kinase n=1 Tax=Albimonas donghaensis TaxID=356660 RepID=A0A1H2QS86_9RHOB|nr:ATP-binding protein [Albimonas donghaensis]SDW10063.1 two-component system, cell cycle sensor histidine kinase and response regulator CckA [Albimonas donghaensis]
MTGRPDPAASSGARPPASPGAADKASDIEDAICVSAEDGGTARADAEAPQAPAGDPPAPGSPASPAHGADAGAPRPGDASRPSGVPAGPGRLIVSLAALALTVLAVAWAFADEATVIALAAFVIGAGLVGLLAGAGPFARLAPARRPAAARAMEALHAHDPVPTAVTDLRGALIGANPALRAALRAMGAGDGRVLPEMIESLFETAPDAVPATAEVYRILRQARLHRRASNRSLRFDGARRAIALALLAPDVLIWRLYPEEAADSAALSDAMEAAGLAMVLRDGGALRANTAARALVPGIEARLIGRAAPPGAPGGPGGAADEAPTALDGTPLRWVEIPAMPSASRPEPEDAGDASMEAPDPAEDASLASRPRGWLLTPGAHGMAGGEGESFDRLPVAIARLDLDGVLLSANEPARRLLGPGAAPGARLSALAEGLGRSIPERIAEAARGRASGRSEIARGRREDRETFLQLSLTRGEQGGAPCLVAVLSDATELKTLEAQFVQSQKMQAVGQLAGGVAHDFNNLLTAIAGHCDLLLMRRDATDADHPDLMQIRQNTNRAAALVRQMLAFSRKQTLRPKVTQLTETLTELSHLLNRLLGEKVQLRLEHGADLGLVRVDERQFEQVVMNLVVNARDAMPGGGEVRIRTRNVTFDREFRRDRAVIPSGPYVAVEVLDSGSGIPPDRIGQIFEPFYTTKKVGEGTGLGLSTAYGIVKQTGGFIFADSPPGAGAVFTVYLPRHEAGSEATEPAALAPPPAPRAAQTPVDGVVLLVEDEAPVRSFATRALGLRGYTVLEAENAEEALALLEDEDLHIDVIVSDVVMPGLDGPSWVKTARQSRPDVAVVFVSGYAEGAFRRSLDGLEGFVFLPKPYSLSDLSAAIQTARENPGEAAA